MTIAITTAVLAGIRAAAAADLEREACGLLTGGTDRIDGVVMAANVADDPRRRFEVDPRVVLDCHRATRRGGPLVVGCWHSHPTGDPTPSATDVAMIGRAGELWLIVGGGEFRCWRAGDGSFAAVVLQPCTGLPSPPKAIDL